MNLVKAIIVDEMNGKSVEVVSYVFSKEYIAGRPQLLFTVIPIGKAVGFDFCTRTFVE